MKLKLAQFGNVPDLSFPEFCLSPQRPEVCLHTVAVADEGMFQWPLGVPMQQVKVIFKATNILHAVRVHNDRTGHSLRMAIFGNS